MIPANAFFWHYVQSLELIIFNILPLNITCGCFTDAGPVHWWQQPCKRLSWPLFFNLYTDFTMEKEICIYKRKNTGKILGPEIQNLGMSTKEIRQWSRHSLKMHLELTKYTHSISWIFFYKINNAKIYVFVIQWKELGRKSVVEGIYCMLWNQMQIINHLCRVIELQLFPLESLEAPCYGDWQFNLLSQPRICCSVWLGQLYNLSVPMSSPKKGHNDTTNITGCCVKLIHLL